MRQVTSIAAMQRWSQSCKAQGVAVGLVPTMGYLHAGHISLVHRARKRVGPRGKIVVSIYVNPLQFAANEDLARYPRDLDRDRGLCRKAGVDVLFVPANADMYPAGGTDGSGPSTYVVEEDVSKPMEGVSRPTHFRGVATVVAKLLNIVLPDVAVFGAKDFQQASLMRRMVRDLNFPVKIIVAPTMREPDGLAMSSRNKYLTGEERRQASVLWQAIQLARRTVRMSSDPLPAGPLRRRLVSMIQRQPAAKVDYVEFFHAETLRPVAQLRRGTQLALAVRLGKTRLIDNGRL